MSGYNTLEKRIMTRIQRIYYFRKLFNPLMLKLYTLVVALFGMVSLVSIGNIIANMPRLIDFGSMYRFVSGAIINTEFSVQIILGIVFVIGVLLARDTIRNLSFQTQYSVGN